MPDKDMETLHPSGNDGFGRQKEQTATGTSGALPDRNADAALPQEQDIRQRLTGHDMSDMSKNIERLSEEQRTEESIYRHILDRAKDEAVDLRSLGPLMQSLHFSGSRSSRNGIENGSGFSPSAPSSAFHVSVETMHQELEGMDSSGNPKWISLTLPQRDVPALLPGNDKATASEGHNRTEPPTSAPVRPRPMRSLIRMLLVTTILGMLYHILSLKGWVPRLF